MPPPLPRGGLGIPQSFAFSPEAPLPGELSGASPTERLYEGQPDREALAKLNLSVIAYAMPPPLPRGGLGIPQSFAFSPEAPLPGELSGASPTERLYEGQPDREALAKLNLSVIAYAMPPPLPRGGLGIPQSLASSPEAPLSGATATTAASGGNRESLLGPRPAGCKRQRSRRWVPQPGLGERSETERLDEGQPDREALAELNLSVTADAVPPPLPRGGLGIPQSLASSPEAPLLGELSAKQTERLDEGQPDREALAELNLSVTADAVPPPLPRGGLGIPQSLASSPEAPLLGELSAKQTERLDEGQPDREALAELNLSVTADAVPPPLPRGGLGIPQSLASSPEAPLLGELAGASPTERLDKGQPDREATDFRP